jgi:hypothetical protein
MWVDVWKEGLCYLPGVDSKNMVRKEGQPSSLFPAVCWQRKAKSPPKLMFLMIV